MKLSAVLVLCCSFFSSSARPLPAQDVDCDDPGVFEAVDIALRKYNEDKRDGNQFALYMVMEANRTADPGKHFFVKYRMRESSCAVGGDKLWQDCDYRASAEAESGECTAHVYIDKAEQIKTVTQECKIIPVEGKVTVSHAPCLGCYYPVPANSLQLLPILKHAIQLFNNQSDQPSLFEVGEIKKATRQVVAGWNYAIEYEVKETNCSRNKFGDLSPACKPIFGGRIGSCEAKAYVDPRNTIVEVAQRCKSLAEETVPPPISVCPGCPRPIPANSTELEEPLRASLEKFNEEDTADSYYKIEGISHATVQVVAGKNYNITFRIRKTNCLKSAVKKLNEDCEALPNSNALQCTAQVHVVRWTNTTDPKVNCSSVENSFIRRPPGLTPFRSLFRVSGTQTKHEERPSEHGHKDEQKNRRGIGSRKEHDHKHGRGHEDEHGHRRGIECGLEHEHRHDDKHGHRQGPERGLGHEDEHGHRRGIECGLEHEHRHDDKHGLRQGPERGRGCGHGHGKHKDKQKNIKNKHEQPKDESPEEHHDEVTNQKEMLVVTPERSDSTQLFMPELKEQGELLRSPELGTTPQPTTALTDGFPSIPDLPEESDTTPDTPLFLELPAVPEPSISKCPGKPWKPIADLTVRASARYPSAPL